MPPSLYANLLDPAASSPATVSGAPVKYSFKKGEQAAANQDKKTPDASLRFQPSIKRPQPQQKQKPRPSPATTSSKPTPPAQSAADPATTGPVIRKWQESQKHDFDLVNEYHRFQQEQKARIKEERKAKKSKNPQLLDRNIDWSSPYNVQDAFTKTRTKLRLDAWKNSESKFNARVQWKEKLHEFRRPGTPPVRQLPNPVVDVSYKNMPPPQDLNGPSEPPSTSASIPPPPPPDYGHLPPPPPPTAAFPHPPPPPTAAFPPPPFHQLPPPPPPNAAFPPPPAAFSPPPPPPGHTFQQSPPPPPPVSAPPASAPSPSPSQPQGVISRAPVRYQQPEPVQQHQETPAPAPEVAVISDQPNQEPEQPSSLPGQKGFAQRYMEKHGWKKGEGLGRDASGITTILRHEPAKRKRKADVDGGGWAQPAAMGRIVGGKKSKTNEPIDETKAFSLVAKFDGMLKDLDVDRSIEEDNLMQKIGDRMNEYGRSERVYIDRETGRVFVKFTSALSAFNAIKASDGVDFLANGRIVQASFFSADKFEEGVYD